MAARWRVRDALLALPAAATKTGDTGFAACNAAAFGRVRSGAVRVPWGRGVGEEQRFRYGKPTARVRFVSALQLQALLLSTRCIAARCWCSGTCRKPEGPRCETSSESRKQAGCGSFTGARQRSERSSPFASTSDAPHSPQGDRSWPEVTNRRRLELLLSFWEARAKPVGSKQAR